MTYKIHKINEIYGGEAYLLLRDKDAVLIDSGYAIGVEGTIRNIEEHLNGRQLEAIILTHSHYDHVMGSPAISEHFPSAKIYAHPITRKIFSKPNALKTMEEMNHAAAINHNLKASDGWAQKLRVDVDVTDGDIITAGDMKIVVIETPGHTWCSISLYIESENLLIANESLGVPLDFPEVVPAFIVNHKDTVESIKRVQNLKPKSVLLPHSKLISGKDVDVYFENSLKETKRVEDLVTQSHKKSCTTSEIVQQLKDIYFKGKFKEYQPEEAFDANWHPLVTKLIQSKQQ